MKTIYLVRHAESEGNAGLHFQGEQTRLTDRGREQAAFVAERCSRIPIDAIVTSSMVRAEETAKVISERISLPYTTSEYFAERRRPSSIIGTSMDDPEAQKINDDWTASLMQGGPRVLDGENYEELSHRAEKALGFLAGHESEHILVVSHGFFMDMLLARAIFREALTSKIFATIFNTFHTSNTGLSMLQFGGKWAEWEVLTWNDHAHLG